MATAAEVAAVWVALSILTAAGWALTARHVKNRGTR